MSAPILLYSTNTWLAFIIGQRYYNQLHWVCCATSLDSKSQPPYEGTNPPSACPRDIYRVLAGDACRGDRHSAAIARNRVGILKGAADKRSKGVITTQQEKEIGEILDQAVPQDFRPLLYIICFGPVQDIAQPLPVAERAHPLSLEYVIPELHRSLFDIVELTGG